MLKTTFLLAICLSMTMVVFGQVANDNTLTVQIDGSEFTTQPRRIRIGNAFWITANAIKPDKSLRMWFGTFDRSDILEPGTYMVVDFDKSDSKEIRKKYDAGSYKGIALIKYVEETRTPRMEYHVGKSRDNDETIDVKMGPDGFLEATFSGKLAGSYWKERGSATVFGGMGRLMNKMEDKVVTKATGYDSDIDPEGNGYKKQPKTDEIVLTNGKARLKIK
ncbi:MAG: hypothetical protein H7319_19255 [Spirosoma sp.]|nr:hypothetical protein [Spirosoma sp.]